MEETGIDTRAAATQEAAEPPEHVSWTVLVEKVRSGDSGGMEDLYRIFAQGVRFFLCRHVGPQELEDRVHDAFLIVAQAIQRGDLREPDRLMGFVRTVVRRQVAAHIEDAVETRKHQAEFDPALAIADFGANPEQCAIERQNQDVARRILRGFPQRDREILVRFYLREQTPAQICAAMDLTENQFRLLKSRAKARFGELGKRRLERHRA